MSAIAERGQNRQFATRHPRGCRQIQNWLDDDGNPGRGQVALASVPYLAPEWQSLLLGMASEHPHPEVQLVGSAVAASLGNAEALRALVSEAVDDHPYQQTAQDALLALADDRDLPPLFRTAIDTALLLIDLKSRAVPVRGWHVLWRDTPSADNLADDIESVVSQAAPQRSLVGAGN